jgi:hypothetical protein
MMQVRTWDRTVIRSFEVWMQTNIPMLDSSGQMADNLFWTYFSFLPVPQRKNWSCSHEFAPTEVVAVYLSCLRRTANWICSKPGLLDLGL